jgi:predicted  nucleic acid-binding Zn-ribbon protein
MEARVARLGAGVSDIKATQARLEPVLGQMSMKVGDLRSDLKEVRTDLKDLRSKDLVDVKVAVAKLEGRVSQLPTTIQMLGFIFVVLAVAGVTKYLGI